MSAFAAQKILIFGASGNTGKYVTKFALESSKNYFVIAFVRNPEKLQKLLREIDVDPDAVLSSGRLQIFQGDLTDEDAIRRAIRDNLSAETKDVIINCAGRPKSCIKPRERDRERLKYIKEKSNECINVFAFSTVEGHLGRRRYWQRYWPGRIAILIPNLF